MMFKDRGSGDYFYDISGKTRYRKLASPVRDEQGRMWNSIRLSDVTLNKANDTALVIPDITEETVKTAMKMIKKFCEDHDNCDDCPFERDHLLCDINSTPNEWKI